MTPQMRLLSATVTAWLLVCAIVAFAPARGAAATPWLRFGPPTHTAVAADSGAGYESPTSRTNIALTLGADGQTDTIRVSANVGVLVLGANQDCSMGAPVIVSSTAAVSMSVMFCARASDPIGPAILVAENLSTPGATPTATINIVGRPAQLAGTVSSRVITATVTDAPGNRVVDGTPVRIAIPGEQSTQCHTTLNGTASFSLSSTASLAASRVGYVQLYAGWNASGSPAVCGAAQQEVAAQLRYEDSTVPSVGGTVASGSIPRDGGFGLIVYGGSTASLLAAAGCPTSSTSAAFWVAVNGEFIAYVPGTRVTAVNAAFLALYGNGIPSGTVLIGRCR
jgi:hypothetical protein